MWWVCCCQISLPLINVWQHCTFFYQVCFHSATMTGWYNLILVAKFVLLQCGFNFTFFLCSVFRLYKSPFSYLCWTERLNIHDDKWTPTWCGDIHVFLTIIKDTFPEDSLLHSSLVVSCSVSHSLVCVVQRIQQRVMCQRLITFKPSPL